MYPLDTEWRQLTSASPSADASEEKPAPATQTPTTRRAKGGRKSGGQGEICTESTLCSNADSSADAPAPKAPRRGSRKAPAKHDSDVDMEDAPEANMKKEVASDPPAAEADRPYDSEDDDDEGPPGHRHHFAEDDEDDEDDMDDDDAFSGYLSRGAPLAAFRALAGAYAGQGARFRNILEQLKSKDPSSQLIALQDLSELLLMANEDTLAGNFQPDAFVRELVAIMNPTGFEEANPEMMLLACRCLANMMEALPAATGNVVYGGAVPVLCSKLLEISFIDLAEQCLSVSCTVP